MATTDLQAWVGRREEVTSSLDPWPAQALRASLDLPPTIDERPHVLEPLWHWLYFLDTPRRSELDPDGHVRRGGFMPPVEAPRRMFAGGRSEYLAPLRLGLPASQRRTILKIEEKAGAAGPLTFVTVGYEHFQNGGLCVREERDLVYLPSATSPSSSPPRSEASDVAPFPSPDPQAWELSLVPDAILLMRFSALTFNSHRIHYDADYCRSVEGYADRVVHGPLSAMLLAELARLNGAVVTRFEFRARAPLLVNQLISLRGRPDGQGAVELGAYDAQGRLAVSARVR